MFALGFVVVGVLCAVRVRNQLLRAAWIVFAIQYGMQAMPLFRINEAAPWLSGALTDAVAVLLILAGARKRSGTVLAAAAAVFVAAIVLRILVTRYAGLHSVMSLEFVVI